MRALAALGVVVFHVGTISLFNFSPLVGGFTSHLDLGVTLFFLLTGFLLYRPFAQAALFSSEPPSVARYFNHRLLRIVPAYWVALTFLGLWPGLEGVFTRQWWVYYGFAQSYRRDWLHGGIAPAWSLSIEVAYYVLLPPFGLALVWLSRRGSLQARLRAQFAALTMLGLSGVALRFWIIQAGLRDLSGTLLAHLLWFALGMSLAVGRSWVDRCTTPRWLQVAIARPVACWVLALAVYTFIALTPFFPRPFDGRQYSAFALTVEHVLYGMIAALVMLPAVFGESAGGLPWRPLAHRSLAWVGAISYGIFLWHAPLLKAIFDRGGANLSPGWSFLSLLLPTLGASIVCGWASYRFIEQPAMRLARSRDRSS